MSNLVLAFGPGDCLIINGAPIRFRTRSSVVLHDTANFLAGKQIMRPEEATTPARRIYFALQTAYVGTPAERTATLPVLADLIRDFQDATTSPTARMLLADVEAFVAEESWYPAIKCVRRLVRHEAAVLDGIGEPGPSHPPQPKWKPK